MPGGAPLEIERKFLLAPADRNAPPLSQAHRAELVQTYLLSSKGETARVRRIDDGSGVRYVHTVKRRLARGVSSEVEHDVEEALYEELLTGADPARATVRKTRWRIPWEGLVVEVDQLHEPRSVWLAEVELASADALDDELTWPPGLTIVREVTDDPLFSNSAIARAGAADA